MIRISVLVKINGILVKINGILIKINGILVKVDSRYLEFDGAMEKIRVNRSSTQEGLRRYRKCGLINNERETTRAKF
jgi:hypothetical protein